MKIAPKVYIIGAGPGDAELITLKGLKYLKEADIVLYDSLANKELLEYCKPMARLINTGKRYQGKRCSINDIFDLFRIYWNNERIIVRLKGGDSVLFARLAEEIEYLANAEIPYEVVPGITSASSLIYAGIIPTNRNHAGKLLLASGRKQDGSVTTFRDIDTDTTVVVYMGASVARELATEFKKSLPGSTAVAVVENASLPDQQVTLTNLDDLEKEGIIGTTKPKLIVVGNVAGIKFELPVADLGINSEASETAIVYVPE